MERRTFIKHCGWASFAGLLGGCSPLFMAQGEVDNNLIKVAKSTVVGKNSFMLKVAILPTPIYVTIDKNQQYQAVLMQCTHKDCELTPAGQVLVCPCHGSEFLNNGQVLQGPAETDLKHYTVSTDNVYIYLKIN